MVDTIQASVLRDSAQPGWMDYRRSVTTAPGALYAPPSPAPTHLPVPAADLLQDYPPWFTPPVLLSLHYPRL